MTAVFTEHRAAIGHGGARGAGAVPNRSSLQVRFYLASRGNRFMAELAAMFVEGFERLGVPAFLETDVPPPLTPPDDEVPVIVAPHEFFPLFLAKETDRRQWAAAAGRWWCLATEQPGSRCFEAGFRFASRCRGVFDINRQGVREFHKRGVHAVYVPLGYTPSIEEPGPAERDIDLVFLGHSSPKRARFLAEHAATLARYRCRLILADVERPRLAGTPGFVHGSARKLLLRRSRILLNVHSADRNYFEWLRALDAMANGCLLVSETSDGAQPLADGQHLVFADLADLMARCEEHLRDEAKRRAIADRAYRFLCDRLPIELGCEQILEADRQCRAAEAQPTIQGSLGSAVRRAGQDLAARARSAWFSVRSLPSSVGPFLRRQRWAHTLYYPARSVFDRARGHWSLAETERRRQAIVRRLAEVEAQGHHGQRTDYEIAANAPYRQVGTPSVSVVVTLYNYAQYVGDCLASVERSQREGLGGGFEVIVVDDASTDDSARAAQAVLDRSPAPGCLVRKASNTGLADARNLGVQLARARRVFILDADNRVYPRCLARLDRTLEESGSAAAYAIISRFDGRTGAGLDLVSWLAWDVDRLVAAPYLDAMAMFDREKLLAVGGYSTELIRYGWFGWEDYDLWLKLAQAGHAATLCPEVLAEYRVHGSSMIEATSHYKPRLVRYFREKFADLAAAHPGWKRQFGWAI